MEEVIVNKDEIFKIMEEIEVRKVIRPNGVSDLILKECKNELVGPIYDIIKCSVATGKVPREWKRAEVVPIHKSGNKEEPLNYRPVSLTSVVCKMCEKVIKNNGQNF